MKILPINNIQNNKQQNFKAKFSAKDINVLLDEIKGYDADLYPKLYTLLERVNELPGKNAKFVPADDYGNYWQLHIDGKSISKAFQFINKYSALYSSLVKHKDNIIKYSDIVRMPERIFEQKWWKNRIKGEEDIRNFSLKV